IRAVLGDEKLNYLGKSYGTYLGTIYAQLFPDKVGRVVLDGAIDPGATPLQRYLSRRPWFG
ncbi:MAG: alpha/beta fold hydrolase, partial [Oxalobacteraceae bacterium]|nr:alpha/beta fold hydrolase [Oxalobacteraceae bacterium]